MLDILITFALSQCMHYAMALATDSKDVEVQQIVCEVTSIDAFGEVLDIKNCVGYNPRYPLVCELEVKDYLFVIKQEWI